MKTVKQDADRKSGNGVPRVSLYHGMVVDHNGEGELNSPPDDFRVQNPMQGMWRSGHNFTSNSNRVGQYQDVRLEGQNMRGNSQGGVDSQVARQGGKGGSRRSGVRGGRAGQASSGAKDGQKGQSVNNNKGGNKGSYRGNSNRSRGGHRKSERSQSWREKRKGHRRTPSVSYNDGQANFEAAMQAMNEVQNPTWVLPEYQHPEPVYAMSASDINYMMPRYPPIELGPLSAISEECRSSLRGDEFQYYDLDESAHPMQLMSLLRPDYSNYLPAANPTDNYCINEQIPVRSASVSPPISEMTQDQVLAVQRDVVAQNARRHDQSTQRDIVNEGKKTVTFANELVAREPEHMNDLSRFAIKSPPLPSWANRAKSKSYPTPTTSAYVDSTPISSFLGYAAASRSRSNTEKRDTTKTMSGFSYQTIPENGNEDIDSSTFEDFKNLHLS